MTIKKYFQADEVFGSARGPARGNGGKAEIYNFHHLEIMEGVFLSRTDHAGQGGHIQDLPVFQSRMANVTRSYGDRHGMKFKTKSDKQMDGIWVIRVA